MNKLTTPVSQDFIFSLDLSYHTKCILFKILTDFICGGEEMDLFYLEDNILSIWPTKVVMNAFEELANEDIMILDLCDCENCQENEDDNHQILFNPEFIEDACPYTDCCSCCEDIPKMFNVIYN